MIFLGGGGPLFTCSAEIQMGVQAGNSCPSFLEIFLKYVIIDFPPSSLFFPSDVPVSADLALAVLSLFWFLFEYFLNFAFESLIKGFMFYSFIF